MVVIVVIVVIIFIMQKKIHLQPNHIVIRVMGYAPSPVSTGYGGYSGYGGYHGYHATKNPLAAKSYSY
jgi:hypothetical protein